MSLAALAFFTGLFSSLHCVAMCGPLMMALPFSVGSSWITLFIQRILYQTGRILTYSLLGAIVGFAGQGFSFLGLQQFVSIASGLLLIVIAIFYLSKTSSPRLAAIQVKLSLPLTRVLSRYFAKPYGSFVAGALNGIIPCGIVYMALATALSSGSVGEASKFMTFFGLGTTPLLLLGSLLPILLGKSMKFKLAFLTPTLLLVSGGWLFIRGLNINIPYILSQIDTSNIPFCN